MRSRVTGRLEHSASPSGGRSEVPRAKDSEGARKSRAIGMAAPDGDYPDFPSTDCFFSSASAGGAEPAVGAPHARTVYDFRGPSSADFRLRPGAPYQEAVLSASARPLAALARYGDAGDPDIAAARSLFQGLLAPFGFAADDILLTAGCTGAAAVVLGEVVGGARRAVLLVAPYDAEAPQWVRHAGGRCDVVATALDAGWQLSADAVARAVRPDTACVLLASPNIPAGVVYDAGALRALVARLRALAHPPVLLVDCVWVQTEAPRWATPVLAEYPRAVFCYSLAKDAGVGGSRVGALCLSRGMRDFAPRFRRRNRGMGFWPPNRLELRILAGVAETPERWPELWRKRSKRMELTRREFQAAIAQRLGLPCVQAERGPPYAFAKLPDGISEQQARERLARGEPALLVGAGSVHGVDGHVRFCLAKPFLGVEGAIEFFPEIAQRLFS
jgi:aspartate/methionine/tyrosine aminotransferase